ncbi:MAG TPA: hypothetical protein VFC44_11185 [Candidatus Saccharimonadales bacterium]|nr:hypothetical protein [Candidatus Saccharimonadales bacterium]
MITLVGHDHLPLHLASRQLHLAFPYAVPDSQKYISLAEGQFKKVESPFSKRILYPWMAQKLTRVAHLSLRTSFLALNTFFFSSSLHPCGYCSQI